jgi:hypothetical protein
VERPGRGATHRRGRLRPAPLARLALALFKGAVLGALLTLVVAGGLHAPPPSAHPDAPAAGDSYQGVVVRAVGDRHCSHAGSGRGVVAASALIRTTEGRLRQVSFEVGWDVYNGRRPGTLVAVCLDEP